MASHITHSCKTWLSLREPSGIAGIWWFRHYGMGWLSSSDEEPSGFVNFTDAHFDFWKTYLRPIHEDNQEVYSVSFEARSDDEFYNVSGARTYEGVGGNFGTMAGLVSPRQLCLVCNVRNSTYPYPFRTRWYFSRFVTSLGAGSVFGPDAPVHSSAPLVALAGSFAYGWAGGGGLIRPAIHSVKHGRWATINEVSPSYSYGHMARWNLNAYWG